MLLAVIRCKNQIVERCFTSVMLYWEYLRGHPFAELEGTTTTELNGRVGVARVSGGMEYRAKFRPHVERVHVPMHNRESRKDKNSGPGPRLAAFQQTLRIMHEKRPSLPEHNPLWVA